MFLERGRFFLMSHDINFELIHPADPLENLRSHLTVDKVNYEVQSHLMWVIESLMFNGVQYFADLKNS